MLQHTDFIGKLFLCYVLAITQSALRQSRAFDGIESLGKYLYTRDPLYPISIMMPCGESNIKISNATDLLGIPETLCKAQAGR
jgi:hypothetical protein